MKCRLEPGIVPDVLRIYLEQEFNDEHDGGVAASCGVGSCNSLYWRFGFLPELAKRGNESARIYVLVARKLKDRRKKEIPITLRIAGASECDSQKGLFMPEGDAPSVRPYDCMVDKEIANLAFHYWGQRGSPCGSPEVDWYRAVEDVNREQTRVRLGLG